MFARMALPRLGGSPGVWNTCMVFFQAFLLAGYAYAHLLHRKLPFKAQVAVHAIVLLLPLLVLPIALPHTNPPASTNPVGWLLLLLTVTVGLPFFAVSTTAPLLQSWFARSGRAGSEDPYFLYAASNVGSMAALLGYPLLAEPRLTLVGQARLWSAGFFVLLGGIFLCAALSARGRDAVATVTETEPAPSLRRCWRWILLAFVPSSYLLGVTTYITTDIAAVPLLWVIPLALYLLTFIIVF